MPRDKPQAAPTARARVPKRGAGTEQPVIVKKAQRDIDRGISCHGAQTSFRSLVGSIATFWPSVGHFRSTRINRHAQSSSACLKRAPGSHVIYSITSSVRAAGRKRVEVLNGFYCAQPYRASCHEHFSLLLGGNHLGVQAYRHLAHRSHRPRPAQGGKQLRWRT
jgi:hypothetical protein